MTSLPPPIPAKAAALQKQLLELYREAQDALRQQLTTAALTDFKKFYLKQHLEQVDAIIAGLASKAAGLPEEIAVLHYRHGADLAGHAMVLQDIEIKAINMGNQIHTAGVQAVADQMVTDLAVATDQMANAAKDILRKTQQSALEEQRINKLLAQGMISGETYRETSQKLTKEILDKIGDGNLIQAGGKRFQPAYYAELVTRTRTREAVTAGALNRGLEYGVTLYQISVHDTSCPVCSQFQGKVYSVIQGDRFPYLERRPPYHPNCRHVLVPYVPDPGNEAETEALADLSNQPGAISDGSAGFAEAMSLAERLANTKLAAKAAEKLAAEQAAAEAAAALRAAKQPILDAFAAIPPISTADDLFVAQQGLQAASAAIKQSNLAAEELAKAMQKLADLQAAIKDAAQKMPVSKLKAAAKNAKTPGWAHALKGDLVEYCGTADSDAAKGMTAAWVQKGKEAAAKAKAAKEAAKKAAKKAEAKAILDEVEALKTELGDAASPNPEALQHYKAKMKAINEKGAATADLEPEDISAIGTAIHNLVAQAHDIADAASIHKLKVAAYKAGIKDTQWATKAELKTLLLSSDTSKVNDALTSIAAKKADSLAKKAAKKAALQAQSAQVAPTQQAAAQAAQDAINAAATPDFKALDALWVDGKGPHTFTRLGDASSLGGAHPKEFYLDENGDKWLFKPLHTNSSYYRGLNDISFLAKSEEMGYKLQRLVYPDAVEVRFCRMPDGTIGSIQRMQPGVLQGWVRPKTSAWDITGITQAEIEAIQREQVIDWLISNHDGHCEQYLRLADGRVLGIDKGQAFKYFPSDRLDWDYNPTQYSQSDRMAANELFYRFSKGEITLDPSITEQAIRRLESIPDDELKEILRPYAESLYAGGTPRGKPASIDEFYAAVVARKHNLRADFEALYSRAMGRPYKFPPPQSQQAAAGRVLSMREKDIVQTAAKNGTQGMEIPLDVEEIEDHRALVWGDVAFGEDRTLLTLKIRPDADKKMLDYFKKGQTQGVGTPVPGDIFYNDILEAVKTVNYHAQDGAYNQARVHKAQQHLQALQALKQSGTPDQRAMAEHYLKAIQELNAAMTQRRKFTGVFEQFIQAPQQPAQPAAFTVEYSNMVFEKRRSVNGKSEVMARKVNLREAAWGHPSISTQQKAYLVKWDAEEIEALYVPQQDVAGYVAQMGRLEIRTKGAVSETTVKKLLTKLDEIGINTAPPTYEDEEWLYLQKQMYLLGWLDPQDGTRYHRAMDALVKDATKSTGQKIAEAKAEFSRILGRQVDTMPTYHPLGRYEDSFLDPSTKAGYRVWERFDVTPAQMQQRLRDKRPYHNLTGSGTNDFLEAILPNNGRMVNTEDKIRYGIPVAGMSPGADMGTGGAGFFFTRVRTGDVGDGIYFKQRNFMRMDALIYDRDKYGNVDPGVQRSYRQRVMNEIGSLPNGDANEADFKLGMNFLQELDYMVLRDPRERREAIEIFKRHGYARLPDGRKIEDVVVQRLP